MQMKKSLVGAVAVLALAGSGLAASAGGASAAVRPAVYGCNYTTATPEISYGDSGAAVKEAQCLLVYWGFSVGPSGVDGQFGADTRSAVRAFQTLLHSDCGLSIDGIVGPMTWHALKNSGC